MSDGVRSRSLRRGAIAGVATVALLCTAAVAPAVNRIPGLNFRISASTKIYAGDTPPAQDNEVMRGRGVAVNDRSRIEFLAFTPLPSDLTTDDFLIGLDSGKVVALHSASNRYTPANDIFGGPAVVALGRVMGGAGRLGAAGPAGADGDAANSADGGRTPRGGRGGRGFSGARGRGGRGRGSVGQGFMNQIDLLDVKFNVEKLGDGGVIDGRPTQHYRVTADYRILWGDQGLPAHAVTEIWTTALPTKIPNPFEPLVVADQSTDGPLIEYALKLRSARAQIDGVPIKVVTTTTLTGIHDIVGFQSFVTDNPSVDKLTIVQQTQITGIAPADVDPALVKVPDAPENP
jgi:hypothetical protein